MLTSSAFDTFAVKYGWHASWAIWNPAALSDTSIISENLSSLKTSVIMVGLNFSATLRQQWSNFHFGRHDRKLMYAFNNSSYRGAYMTDIVKEADSNAARLLTRARTGEVDIGKHIDYFHNEMNDLRVQAHSLFILFGKDAQRLFSDYLGKVYPNFVACPHYSNYGRGYSDEEYLRKLWEKLEKHFTDTRLKFNTPEFTRPISASTVNTVI